MFTNRRLRNIDIICLGPKTEKNNNNKQTNNQINKQQLAAVLLSLAVSLMMHT